MLDVEFLEKTLGLASSPHFVHGVSKNVFSCYLLLTGQILFSNCLYFLRFWPICAPVCDHINFEINLTFL